VVLVDGAAVLYLDRGGRRLRTLAGAEPSALRRGFEALRALAHRRPRNTLTLEKVDGVSAVSSDLAHLLQEAGFVREYLSLRLYAP
jgi:ATP-dependent Lhr-like helicase